MTDPLPLLALFFARAGDSRLAELEAVAQRLGAPELDWRWDPRVLATNGGDVGPRIVQWLPPLPEQAWGWLADAAAGSVGCRGIFEVWGQGDTIEACASSAAAVSAAHIQARVQGSWRVSSTVLGARKSRHPGSLGERMTTFDTVLDALACRPVDLTRPQHRVWLVEDGQSLQDKRPIPDPPPRFLLLYELPAHARPIQERTTQLALRKRAFLSTSTLPADRALLLCNLALARAPRSGATVLDPYCGSGGILLAAAALGAHTVGSDLDWRLVSNTPWPVRIPGTPDRPLRGVERVCMRDNFVEAGLESPKALLTLDVGAANAADLLLQANDSERFDALVCDPPYGRREFQRGQQGWGGELSFKVDTAALGATLRTLLTLARQTLKAGGRLVFLAPVRSPRDPNKPDTRALRTLLERAGSAQGLRLVHLGEEVVHGGLHRAVVVMDRT